METKWEQEAKKRDMNGNKVKTRTKSGKRMGTKWDKNGNKVGTRTQKLQKNRKKVAKSAT